MASYPALELRIAQSGGTAVEDLLYAELDTFEPLAIEHEDASAAWRVFFKNTAARDAARQSLADSFAGRFESLTAVDVDDEDWARRSQAALTSITVGRITVSPPWDILSDHRQPGLHIIIDPSMGFGTGHHATTRLCLQLLQDIDVTGRDVLDVGTGSGVLAIAARMLGARAVAAIDNDPDALQNARDNIARNGVTDAVRTTWAELGTYSAVADIVLANLTGAVLQRYAGALVHLVRPGGRLIVSGFSSDERDDVVATLGAPVQRHLTEGEWAAALIGGT